MAIHHTSVLRSSLASSVAAAGEPRPKQKQRRGRDHRQDGRLALQLAAVRSVGVGTSGAVGEPVEDHAFDRPRLHDSLRRTPG